ncbi:U-box domain-containing protein 28-like [Cynara cardunculus var. scolymus]|uniref:U-box domain-containing protein n=1 Tax=Cynara cardunculus var. scolymus TaxID=59895 RepID=A0A103XZ25_CYNCS|nr:U-box domain-containing protein 28-like [Cynara cardunculus var. scolymus]KVH99543.1 Armadillo-like helical [Cynara cardunculus var. scolymus]
MARDKSNELYLSVPSFFKCPISMDVMKSPVSLCTGVTYDRTSIQNWLDSGHNTCPATMQVLHSTDVVPNLTLRRLIRVWSDSSLLCPESHAIFNNPIAIDYITKLISNGETENLSLGALLRIVELAKLSEEGRESLANLDGFVPMMVRILKHSDEVEVVELVVTALDLILSIKGVKDRLKKFNLDDAFFSPFNIVLQKGSLDARIRAARVLESLAVFDNESRRVIADQKGLLNELYHFTNTLTDWTAIDVGLAALIAISTSRQVKKELVRLGIVRTAARILSDSENPVGMMEKAMKVLQMVSTCREGRTAISEDEKCVTAVVQRLIKVSTATTELGIVMIWSVCYMWRDRSALEAAMRNNGLTKVLLVMQSNCSGTVKQMCRELVKVFRVNSKSCLASYETRTTHITPY